MKLSIIIPTYNVQDYIGKCLDSLLLQGLSHDDYEIIVVNDGCTDKSLQIAQAYESKYENIRTLSQENQGISVARNAGLEIAKGEYIYFIDPDDYLLTNSLVHILGIAEKYNADIVSFRSENVNEDDNPKLAEFVMDNEVFISSPISGSEVDKRDLFPLMMTAWFYIMKRDLLTRLNLTYVPELRYCEDTPFTLTVFMEAQRVVITKLNIHRYLVRSDSVLRNKDFSHKKIMVDNYIRASLLVNEINERYCPCRSEKGYKREKSRIYIWLLYSLMNMLKIHESPSNISSTIKKLRKENLYPIGDISAEFGYSGAKFNMLKWICNQQWLLITASRLLSLFKI